MKKRIVRLLLAAVTLFSVMSAVSAVAFAESYGIVRDYADVFTDEEEAQLVELLDDIAADTGYNMAIVAEDNIGSRSSKDYASDALETSFGADSDAILLLISNDFDKGTDNYDWIEFSGRAADEHYEEINDMLDCFYGGLDANGYFAGAMGFCGYFGVTSDVTAESTPAYTYKVNLADYQDKIPASEQVELMELMQACANEIECNVGVVITDDIQGMSDESYTKKFTEDSFGKGSNSIALLLNNDRSNDYYGYDWIYTYGLATDLYDHQTKAIFDYLYIGMDSDGGDNYSKAIEYFCAYLIGNKDGGIAGDYNDYYDDENYYQSGIVGISLMGILVPVVIAGIVSACVTSGFTSGYSKKKPISARNYMDSSKTKYNRRDDIYLRETTTHVRISSSSGGGGGGSRGGGGGRSRSGGGGGGGRRR